MKLKLIKILTIFSILILPLNAFAKNIKGELIMNDDVSKGEELKVSIKLKQDGNEEIDVFEGIIDFDENIFEGIDEQSFELQNGWAEYEYNKKTHALIVINKYGSTLNEDIISFNLVLKDNFTPKTTHIDLQNVTVANQNADIELENVSNDLEVNLLPNELSNTTKKESFASTPLINKPVRIYYTLILILLELIIAIVIILLYRVASKRITSKFQKRTLVATLILIEIVSVSAFFGAESMKGDLNSDKSINQNDVKTLAQHLVNSNMISNFKLESADMNGDGKITPMDLSILLRKTYAKTQYVAALSEALMESNGYEKSSVIDLRFFADVTNDEEIEFVLIEGKKYKAEKVKNSKNEYMVKMPLSNISKEYNYTVTEIILANGRSAKVDYKTNVMVLKDIPELTSFAAREDLENSKVRVALTIKDDDFAITNSIYELIDNQGNLVKKGILNVGKNALEFTLENATSYKLNVKINYNRGNNSGEYYGIIEDSYDLKIVTDYKLKISNLKLVQNGTATKYLEKGTSTNLEFNSSNLSGYAPKKVNIGGKEYKVTNIGGGKYRVNIPNTLLNGSPITISKVILSNGKVILTKISTNYSILNRKPNLKNFNATENPNNSTMNIKLDLEDTDKTLNNITVKMFDTKGNLIDNRIITDSNYNIDLATKDTSKYDIKVYASYSLLPNNKNFTYNNELIYETTVDAFTKAYVNSNETSNLYPEKNSILNLNYNITSNYEEPISQIIVNNIIYDAKKIGIDKYQIELNVGDISGVKEYKAQKVILQSGKEANINVSNSIDVLKDYPVLDNLEIIENIEESKINMTFDFYDNDGAFTSGIVRLSNKETGEIAREENIIIGKNNIEFTLENAVKYNIDVLANCILDTKTLNSESPNIINEYNMYNSEYRIIKDYKLEITDIEASKEDEISDYFAIDENINLSFKSTNVSEFEPIKIKVDGKYYDLEKLEDKYKFVLDSFQESGVKVLKIESIVLSNLKEIAIDCTKKIEILKSVPVINEIETITENDDVIVKLQIEDKDNILNNKHAIIVNEKDEEIFNGAIENEIRFTKNSSKKYIIKVYGNYDLDTNELTENDNEFIDAVLFEKVLEEIQS